MMCRLARRLENAGFQLRKEEIRFRYARLVSAVPMVSWRPCYRSPP